MKKLLVAVLIIVIAFVSIYIFIPAKITFSKVIFIKTKPTIANRFLMDETKWNNWFPFAEGVDKGYRYNNYNYSIKKQMMNTAEILMENKQASLKSIASIISMNKDSIAIEWKSEFPKSFNPIKKLMNYFNARGLQKNMNDILNQLKIFLENTEKVYGFNFHEIISKDSTLIATKCETTTYPTTNDIYTLVKNLKQYIYNNGAKESNYPMLHVKQLDNNTFETMVAIPINKRLEGNGIIFSKRFVPWKVLTARINGGNYTVNKGFKQMELYLTDFQKTAMAIPFASLETDRNLQPDTSKWITSIYTPVP
ncbi:MAG: hypothetical protein ABI691_02665 [Ginsengibacter sp.]